MILEPEEALSQFAAVWNMRDPGRRLLLLRACCSERAEFSSPFGLISGIESFNDSISGFLSACPNAEVLFGAPDAHNGHARVRWRTLFNDGDREPLAGDDFIEFDADGRLLKVISFNGNAVEA